MTKTEKPSEPTTMEGYKKTKLGWIPEDWEVLQIKQLFTFLKTNSFSRKELAYSEDIDCVRNIHYGDIHSSYNSGILDCTFQNQIPKIKKSVEINSNHEYLIDGDLIIADASEDYEGVGSAIELINVGKQKILSGLHTIALRGSNSKTAIGFRNYILSHEKVKHELKRIATGTKVYGISKYNIQKLNVVAPPVSEQIAIANCLSTWDTAITKQSQLIAAKKELKKALMQQLLTGKKRLPGFDGEWSKIGSGAIFKSISIKNHPNEELLSVTQDKGVIPRTMLAGRVTMPSGKRDRFKLVKKGIL